MEDCGIDTYSFRKGEQEVLGVAGLSLTRSMADFYVLERLTADGSPRAKRMLHDLERNLAPRLAHYISFACGGELRHLPRQGFDEDEVCYSEYYECGCYVYDHEMNHRNSDYCPEDCDLDEDDEDHECIDVEWWCDWPSGDWTEPGPHGCDCYRCTGWTDEGHWRGEVPDLIEEYLDRCGAGVGDDNGRQASWWEWIKVTKEVGLARALSDMVPAFDYRLWNGGYGGTSWQTAAKVAADYVNSKISARLFIDRCWTLQHNGGMLFDKVWTIDHCRTLQHLLEQQAEDNYQPLARNASPDVRSLWRVREYHISGRADRAAEWLGTQPTWDTEVEW